MTRLASSLVALLGACEQPDCELRGRWEATAVVYGGDCASSPGLPRTFRVHFEEDVALLASGDRITELSLIGDHYHAELDGADFQWGPARVAALHLDLRPAAPGKLAITSASSMTPSGGEACWVVGTLLEMP